MHVADGAELHFATRAAPDGFALGHEGFAHPVHPNGSGRGFTRYEDLTHLALSERHLWIAARSGLLMVARSAFVDRGDPERLLEALTARLSLRPGGSQQLRRMAALSALGRRGAPPLVTISVAVLCAVGYLLEATIGLSVFTVGYFSPRLVADGDWWRIVTATLLHGFPLHLLLNLVGLVVIGRMVERIYGAARTLCVMAFAAVGSMLASGLFLDAGVVGVSGVVFGLAGAILSLELRQPEWLPAWWRLPRGLVRFVLVALAVDFALGFLLPFIAGAAHLGGFVAGALAALLLPPPGRPAGVPVRALAAATAVFAAVAVGAASWELRGSDDFAARHAARLARLPGISPEELNNHAWVIAIDAAATRAQLEAALALAERAVDETSGREATILDTLAEVQFQLGRREDALATIDRAIAREPRERYYREQRRRFTGERAADDRPEAPGLLPSGDGPTLPPDTAGLSA